MNEIKIALNEEDFRCLVRGGVLTINDASQTVKILLNDIGFIAMTQAMHDAEGGVDNYVPHERSNEWRPYDKKAKDT